MKSYSRPKWRGLNEKTPAWKRKWLFKKGGSILCQTA
jgi:hypothetical protein